MQVMFVKKGWHWLKGNSDAIKIVFTLVAAGFVLWQYFEAKAQDRVKQTMAFQAQFDAGHMQQAYRDLEVFMIENKKKFDAASNPNKEITKLVIPYEDKILLLTTLYSQVTTCVKNNVCDLDVACSIFERPIVEMRDNFYDLFGTWKKQWGQNFIAGPYGYFKNHCPKVKQLAESQ